MSYRLWRPYERNMIILLYNILSGFSNYFIVIYWSIQQYYIMPEMEESAHLYKSITTEATMMFYRLWRPYERNMILLFYNILSGFRNYFIVFFWFIQQGLHHAWNGGVFYLPCPPI